MKCVITCLLVLLPLFIIVPDLCSAQCPIAQYPRVISGKKAGGGVTTVQAVTLDSTQQIVVAGGYSNELDSATITPQFHPWIARFVKRGSETDPVMQSGYSLANLLNYQVLSVSYFEYVNTFVTPQVSEYRMLMQLRPIQCTSGSQKGYIAKFSWISTIPLYISYTTWEYSYKTDCSNYQDEYLNRYYYANSYMYFARIAALSPKVIIVDTFMYDSNYNPQEPQHSAQSVPNYDLIGFNQGEDMYIFMSNLLALQQIVVAQVAYYDFSQSWTQELDLYYYEAPIITQVIKFQKICLATKASSGGFQVAIININAQELILSILQFKITHSSPIFNTLKLRGMNMVSNSMHLLLMNTQNVDYLFHLITINTISKEVTFEVSTLPKFTQAPLPHRYVGIAYFIPGSSDYFIGLSSQGGNLRKNNLGIDDITLSPTSVCGLILTNIQSKTCQLIDPLDPTVSPSLDLMDSSSYFYNDIGSPSPSSYRLLPKVFTTIYFPPKTFTIIDGGFIDITQIPPGGSPLIVTENIDVRCRALGLKGLRQATQIVSIIARYPDYIYPNLQFSSMGFPGCPSATVEIQYSLVGTIDPAIGSFDFKTNKILETEYVKVLAEFDAAKKFWIKAYSLATYQTTYQFIDLQIQRYPPFFIGYNAGDVIGIEKINVLGKLVKVVPSVDFSPMTTATAIVPPVPGLSINIVRGTVDSTNSVIILDVKASLPYVFQTYDVDLSLNNVQGSFPKPYYLKITLEDTVPTFSGFLQNSSIGQSVVQVTYEESFDFPFTNNLENQFLRIEITDKKTDKKLRFIKIQDLATMIFTPTLQSQAGLYTLIIKLLDERGLYTTYFFSLEVLKNTNKGPSIFNTPFEDQHIKCRIGQTYNITLPKIVDPDVNDRNPELTLDIVQYKFVLLFLRVKKLASDSYQIIILVPEERKLLVTEGFQYKVDIIINDHSDLGELTAQYKLFVEFEDPKVNITLNQTDPYIKPNKNKLYRAGIKIGSIDRMGNALIQSKSGGSPFGLQNIAYQVNNKTFKLRILKKPMVLADYEVIEINNVTSSIKIKIDFKNISLVSDGPKLDILEIIVHNDSIFFEPIDFKIALEKDTFAQKEVPPQLDPKNKFLIALASYFQNGQLNLSSNKALNIISIVIIQMIWNRLNDLSFFTINFIISMTVPGVVQMISYVIFNFIYMDLLQTDYWLQSNIMSDEQLEDDSYVNGYFFECGYQSMQLMKNLGSTLAYLIIYFVLWFLVGIFFLLKRIPKIEIVYSKLLSKLKWTWSLQFKYSQLCPLLLSSIINIYDLRIKHPLDIVQSIFSVLILSTILVVLIIQVNVIRKANKMTDKSLEYTEFMSNYGFLFEDQSVKNVVGRSWKLIEAVRWSLTLIILTVLRDIYTFQITSLLILSVIVQSLNLGFHPFQEKNQQRIIIFNEIMTSIYLYLTLLLTDFWGDNNPFRDQIGLSLLFLVTFTVSINVAKSFFQDIIFICRKVKMWIERRKRQREERINDQQKQKRFKNKKIPILNEQTKNQQSNIRILEDDIVVQENLANEQLDKINRPRKPSIKPKRKLRARDIEQDHHLHISPLDLDQNNGISKQEQKLVVNKMLSDLVKKIASKKGKKKRKVRKTVKKKRKGELLLKKQ